MALIEDLYRINVRLHSEVVNFAQLMGGPEGEIPAP